MQLILLLELVMIILEAIKILDKLIAVEGEPIHREQGGPAPGVRGGIPR
jgi:hypothetical protein